MSQYKFKLIEYDGEACTFTQQEIADLEKHYNEEISDDTLGKFVRFHINQMMIILGYKFVEVE
ncbi:hypothetical protein [Bacillus sp. J37]|uniref:hypothetical protein n=1 Tax=Bacillus sp. J37 TaxID=935837 RepID=UPI00047CE16A|nr:hypothetical protein [Bacillus sp. J37]